MRQKILDAITGVMFVALLYELFRPRSNVAYQIGKLHAQMIATRVLDARYIAGEISKDEYTEAVDKVWAIQ